MVLDTLQTWLTDFYALDVGHSVQDFLITDGRVAGALDREGRANDEKLLIAESDGEAEVGLFVAQAVIDRLASNDPTARLDGRNLADFWTAFEGVSHFTYYAFRASQDHAVTLLEMELQAEVDKFVATATLLQSQGGEPPTGLHKLLFDDTRFAAELSADERERYEYANRYAGKYCLKLWPRLASRRGWDTLQRELRDFYRLTRNAKIEHIDAR